MARPEAPEAEPESPATAATAAAEAVQAIRWGDGDADQKMTQKWGKEWSFYQRCGFKLQHDTTKLWYVPEIYRNMVVD